ncbi:60S ribosomal protein L24 [Tanacetum coccineum]
MLYPRRYYMETSVAAYKHLRFGLEGLPADLIRRQVDKTANILNMNCLQQEQAIPVLKKFELTELRAATNGYKYHVQTSHGEFDLLSEIGMKRVLSEIKERIKKTEDEKKAKKAEVVSKQKTQTKGGNAPKGKSLKLGGGGGRRPPCGETLVASFLPGH